MLIFFPDETAASTEDMEGHQQELMFSDYFGLRLV